MQELTSAILNCYRCEQHLIFIIGKIKFSFDRVNLHRLIAMVF